MVPLEIVRRSLPHRTSFHTQIPSERHQGSKDHRNTQRRPRTRKQAGVSEVSDSEIMVMRKLNRTVFHPGSDLIFSIPRIISFLSQGTVLLPGTIVLTG
jgi:hypothetical protein